MKAGWPTLVKEYSDKKGKKSVMRRYPFVWRLWISRFCTANAKGIGKFAIQWLATTFPNPAFALGCANTFGSLGSILSGYMFGWLSDNFSPVVLMVSGNLVGAIFTVFIGFMLQSHPSIASLISLVFLWNVFTAITTAASRTLVPQTVDKGDLPKVNSWMGIISPIQQFLSKGFAGVLIATGLFHAFLAAGIVMLLSVLSLFHRRPYPQRPMGVRAHRKKTVFLSGIHIVWSNSPLRRMVIYTSIQNFGFSFFLGEYVLFLKHVRHFSVDDIGVGLSTATIGTVASLIFGPRMLRTRVKPLILLSPLLISAGIAVISLVASMSGFIGGLTLLELGSGFANQTVALIRQRIAPIESMGATTGALNLLHSVLDPVALGLAALIAIHYGTAVTLTIAWVLVLLSTVFAWRLSASVSDYLKPD